MAKKKKSTMRNDSETDISGLGAEAAHMDFFSPDCEPASSLYTSSVLQLFFGPEQKEFTVFSTLLDQYPKISSLENAFYGAQIHLPNVDADVGHTMVHYFFTRRYQTLSLQDVSDEEKNAIEYGRALMTYYASRTYELHDLAMLAQNRIEELSPEVKISSALDRIKAVFESGLSEDYWLKAHLDSKLYAVLRLPESHFETEELTSRIGSVPAFDKAVVEILSRMTRESLRPPTNHAEKPPSEAPGEEDFIDDEEPSSIEKDELQEPEMWDEPAEAQKAEPPAEPEESLKTEEAVADPPQEEQYPVEEVRTVDDFVDGYPADAAPEPAPEAPPPADTDSYLKPDAYNPYKVSAPDPEAPPVLEPEAAPEPSVDVRVVDEPPPSPPPPAPVEVVDDYFTPPPPPPPTELPSEKAYDDPPPPPPPPPVDYPSPPEEIPKAEIVKEEPIEAKPEKEDDLWALPTKKNKKGKKSPIGW
ncbi:hypothetical protein M1816_001852 [Neofusicoccum parvum]|uniref:Uncharacterized protein n=1 Tax=Neofusicoccum parvum TaxID=310453 RepID=A0ACB5SFU4_9PEZI|nr:hypothetical protein M1816_001852 [Neofusicoccum parvum]